MNPRDLVDRTTGRIIPAQVMRAAHARAAFLTGIGRSYRELLAVSMRNAWALAKNEAHVWTLENGAASNPLPYMGGRAVDTIAHERSV